MNILISVSERSNAAFNNTTTMRTQPIYKPERFVTKKIQNANEGKKASCIDKFLLILQN